MTAAPAAAQSPTTQKSPARDLIARLEAIGEQQDEIHRRLIDTLKTYAEASECYLEAVERQIERTALARSAVVVEAAFLIAEQEDDGADKGRFHRANGRLYSALGRSRHAPMKAADPYQEIAGIMRERYGSIEP